MLNFTTRIGFGPTFAQAWDVRRSRRRAELFPQALTVLVLDRSLNAPYAFKLGVGERNGAAAGPPRCSHQTIAA
jgi:hypothetical protein